MKELKDLAYVLTRYAVREVDVITNPDRKPTKTDNRYWEFYTGLREGRWQNDEEAARHFGMEPTDKSYNRLKNELKRRMRDTVLFIDPDATELTEYSRRQQLLFKEWAQCSILLRRGATTAFLELAQKCLKSAMELEQIEIVIESARAMMTIMLRRAEFQKKHRELETIVKQSVPILNASIEIQLDYNNIIIELVQIKGYKKGHAPKVDALVEKYRDLALRTNHFGFQIYYKILTIYAQTLRHHWAEALLLAEDAANFAESKKYPSSTFVIMFLHQKTGCLIMLNRHIEANATIEKSKSLGLKGTAIWFKCHELSVANALYAESYLEAWQTVKDAMHHERFSDLAQVDQESWRLYYGYLSFLAQRGDIALSPREKGEMGKFRMQNWLNGMPLFNNDKRGANIPLLLLQALFLCSENNFDGLEDRVEALRKYRQRNLDPDHEHFRTDVMIRLLELLIKHRFEPTELRAKAAELLAQMSAVSVDLLDRSYEIEVVPYERQWSWFMEARAFPKKLDICPT
jgi:hypothetical protein